MDDRDRTIADMNEELERLRRRIAELESGAAPGIYDERYRMLFESNPLPLWVYDLKTLSFLAVNNTAVRKYGYSREEFLGMTIADIRPSEDIPLLRENIACVTCGLDEAGLWCHRKKDGTIIDVEIVSHTLNFEGREAELVLANDITERRQAEAKFHTMARLYAFLSQINQAIVRTRDRDELFRTICRVAIEFGQFRMAWVGLIEDAGVVRPVTHAGYEDGYLSFLTVRLGDTTSGKGPTGSALREGVLTICDDIATDPRMLPWREEALKRGYRSSAAIPFRLKEKVIGSLSLYAAGPGFFTEDELKLMTEIGIDISFALDTMEGESERKRAEGDLRYRTQGLATLLKVSKGLAATLDLETVLQATTDGVTHVFGIGTAAVYLLDGDMLRLGATTPPLPPQFPEELRNATLADHPHINQTITSRMPVLVPDMTTAVLTPEENAVVKQRGLRTVLFLPLIAGVKPLGTLIVGTVVDPRTISESEIDLCLTLANLAALAVENARLFKSGQRYTADLEQKIVEREQAEEALRESEERLRLALSAAKQGLYDLNVQTGETIVSPEYAQMLGYAPEEFIETNAKWIERLHPDDRAPVAETYRAYIKGALPEYRVEFRQRTKSGEWKWILSIGKIVEYDDSGNPFRMLGTHTDITDRKKAEQERLDMERRLLHAQKLESLGVLAGGIAHDFNNLLMAMLGNLDMALIKLPPDSPAVMNIEQSAQAARRASDLTRQMLAYSGKGSFIVKPMDLEELVTENAHLFRSSVARTTELNVSFDRSLPAINADAGQIQQVIMNLITNASEAIGEKTGIITLATGVQDCDSQCLKRSRVEDVPDAGRFVFLEVSDNGCGMDEQTQQRLFDPFFTTKPKGRGLGMSAILGIVRGHRGALFVESTEGRGTTIRVLFPALQRPMPVNDVPAGAVANGAAATEINGMVLVADDEAMVLNVCKQMVEALGLQVLTAVDGRDAVEVFTKHVNDIALVILDLSMPNMDGLTAFKELARIKPGVKVILCSGFDEQDSLQRFSGKGLAGFMQKPYSIDNLRAAMENAVRFGG